VRALRVRLAARFLAVIPPWLAEWHAIAARMLSAAVAAAVRSGHPGALRAVYAAGELAWICPRCWQGVAESRPDAVGAHRLRDGRWCNGGGLTPGSWRFIPWSAGER
jgi:hypothetical protein